MADKKEVKENVGGSFAVMAPRADIFASRSLIGGITANQSVSSSGSNAGLATTGLKIHPHPLNMKEAISLKDYSTYHSTCIQTKKNCTVGLGFLSDDDIRAQSGEVNAEDVAEVASLLTGAPYIESDVDTALDPLTLFGFSQALLDAVEDFEDTGNGFLEVARANGKDISYIAHVPSQYVHAVTQNKMLFYRVRTITDTTVDKYFSRFGLPHKKLLFSEKGPYHKSSVKEETISELIHFRRPTNRCQFYGYPDWLAAAISIDLAKKSQQYKADFLHNRGVLDFILSVTGGAVDPQVWKEIQSAIKGTSGTGNNWKSVAMNIVNEKAKVQVDKLAQEQKSEDQYAKDNETFSQTTVSAHRVPPLLANILIPGKLGATNELMNALIGFQLLVIGPDQQIIQKTLAASLGDDNLNGKLKLNKDDFRLRTLTSQINLEGLNTLGNMREEAATSNRDLADGVKD